MLSKINEITYTMHDIFKVRTCIVNIKVLRLKKQLYFASVKNFEDLCQRVSHEDVIKVLTESSCVNERSC